MTTIDDTPVNADAGWRQAGEAWGSRALDWAYLFEPYARSPNELIFDKLDVGPESGSSTSRAAPDSPLPARPDAAPRSLGSTPRKLSSASPGRERHRRNSRSATRSPFRLRTDLSTPRSASTGSGKAVRARCTKRDESWYRADAWD